MILLPQHPGFFFFQNMYSYSFFLLWLFSKWWLYSHGIYFFPQNNNLNLNLCFFFLPPSVALILYYTVPMSRYYRCSFSAVVSFGSEWTWKYLCCWEWWVERICLPHVPALQQKKNGEEHDYWSQQEHYKSSHLTLLLFSLSGPPVVEFQFAPREQDTSFCLFHLSRWSIFHSRNNW